MSMDEFSYTFRRHSIVLTREDEDRNWYIVVTAPSGLKCYDGWWRDSAGKPLKDALQEAKEGAMLVKPVSGKEPA
jgi:predicted RNase H-like HicB family nuclease